MADNVITLEFLAHLSRQTLDETRILRKDVADVRTLGLQNIEYSRRIEHRVGEVERRMGEVERRVGEVEHRVGEVERRVGEQREDLELMIKAELMGGMANMQTQLEGYLQPINDRLLQLDKLEERVQALEGGH